MVNVGDQMANVVTNILKIASKNLVTKIDITCLIGWPQQESTNIPTRKYGFEHLKKANYRTFEQPISEQLNIISNIRTFEYQGTFKQFYETNIKILFIFFILKYGHYRVHVKPSILSWWPWLISFESASQAKSNDTNLHRQLEAVRI